MLLAWRCLLRLMFNADVAPDVNYCFLDVKSEVHIYLCVHVGRELWRMSVLGSHTAYLGQWTAFDRNSREQPNAETRAQWKQPLAVNKSDGRSTEGILLSLSPALTSWHADLVLAPLPSGTGSSASSSVHVDLKRQGEKMKKSVKAGNYSESKKQRKDLGHICWIAVHIYPQCHSQTGSVMFN